MGCTQSNAAKTTTGGGATTKSAKDKPPQLIRKSTDETARHHSLDKAAPGSPPKTIKPTPQDIYNRIESIDATQTATIGGVSVRYAYLSQRGFYPRGKYQTAALFYSSLGIEAHKYVPSIPADLDKNNQDSYSVMPGNFGGRETDAFFGVFDGHGAHGDQCSGYVRDNLPTILSESFDFAGQKCRMDSQVINMAHKACNQRMKKAEDIHDEGSGTTAISINLRGDIPKISVSCVGDSRAIIGSRKDDSDDPASSSLVATALSTDQTPWRADERRRIEAAGGRVLTQDQLFGRAPITQVSDKVLGDVIDESGQPPRVFSSKGAYPGLAITRTMGDRTTVDEHFGIITEPEVKSYVLSSNDKILFLASDGVWEFITNQEVIDICDRCGDPLNACREIQAKSCKLWLQETKRTDDITMICIFLDEVNQGSDARVIGV